MKVIQYENRTEYGEVRRYVVDKEIAEALRKVTGMKTLSFGVMDGLRDLGFTFEQVFTIGDQVIIPPKR